MKKGIALFVLALFLGLSSYITVRFYSYIFAKTVDGEVIEVDRVNQATTILSGNTSKIPTEQLVSFAVAIRGENGEIITASSEDRQWSVVQKGQCAEMKFFPYPPWNLDKAGTYFGARLLRLHDCKK